MENELVYPSLLLLVGIVLLLWVNLIKARLEHKELVPALRHMLGSLLKREKKVSLNVHKVGMVLSF